MLVPAVPSEPTFRHVLRSVDAEELPEGDAELRRGHTHTQADGTYPDAVDDVVLALRRRVEGRELGEPPRARARAKSPVSSGA